MCHYRTLSLFGLVLNLRHINLFPSKQLPDASSVVLISQSVQERVDGGRGLRHDGRHLQRGTRRGGQRLKQTDIIALTGITALITLIS